MKLIILNGPAGVGKSIISARLQEKIANSVVIDIDELRRSIPDYKKNREESLKLSFEKAKELTGKFLKEGKSVLIDKGIFNADTLDSFTAEGSENGADVFEFLLFADKEAIQARADERGYIPGSLLTGTRVGELWEQANALRAKRPKAILIDTKDKSIEETLEEVLQTVSR